jgi:penicillin-insensitive murein endopeptidase
VISRCGRLAAPLLAASLLAGCVPWGSSVGTVADGMLRRAVQLPGEGPHHRCYHRAEMRFGTRELVGLVERSAARVAAEAPGAVLYVGDLSAERGGPARGHSSHQAGRDVDLAYFVAEPSGRALRGRPVTRFDRFGVGFAKDPGGVLRLDAARNWSLVEALLGDEEARVQWIFASDGVKALLLRWALDHDRDAEALERAASVIRRPGDSAPHDDHFHVRIYCPRSAGRACVDIGPVWPWVEGTGA